MTEQSVSRDTLPLTLIDPDPDQPRRQFDETALAELAESMTTTGLAEPILVRAAGDRYTIVCGERRWRAAQLAEWAEIPARVQDIAPADVPYLQLAENISRSSLSPIEEARSFRRLLDAGDTQQQLAARIGKDRSYVAQKLRLLDLPAPLTLLVDRGALSEGHVRQLLRIRGLYTPRHVIGAVGDEIDYGSWASIWDDTASTEARANLTFILLRSCRPEDWPPAYPFNPSQPLVADAAEAFCREVDEQGHAYPQWAQVAFYFAALTVQLKVSVANLDRLIDGWIARVKAALIYCRDIHGGVTYKNAPESVSRDTPGSPYKRMRELLWWDHMADLRHAGLLVHNDHIGFEDAMEAMTEVGLPLPSECQPHGPHHKEYREIAARIEELEAA